MARPQTLAEVAEIARANPADFAMALDEFVDEFYLDHPDKVAQQRRVDPIPEPVSDARIDAWIGAAGEHLAQRWGLRVPAWTRRPAHFALEVPVFMPDSRALRGVLIVESPPAFRSRLLFTRAEPLARARFPAGVPRAQVALEWPPSLEVGIEGIADLAGSVQGLPADLSVAKKKYLKATGYGRKGPR
jgi:hypothetical protein